MKLGEGARKFVVCELPIKWHADAFPTILRVKEPFGDSGEIGKVIGSKNAYLNVSVFPGRRRALMVVRRSWTAIPRCAVSVLYDAGRDIRRIGLRIQG